MRVSPFFFTVVAIGSVAAAHLTGAATQETPSTSENSNVVAATRVPPPSPKEMSHLSEAFGHLIGQNLENPVVYFNIEQVIKGLRDNASGKASPIAGERFQEIIDQLEEKALAKVADENLQAAEDFLAQNAKNGSVTESIPGKLQYEILSEGDGPSVELHSAPVIHYKGICLDGTVIGDSTANDSPVSIPLDQTVPGFQQAVTGMKVGEKRKIYIHPELGYGKTGTISPNSLIMFEVEVLGTTPSLPQSGKIQSTASTVRGGEEVVR